MKLLLLSGGIDSAAIAYWHRPDVCLTIDYGQRPARGEIAAASGLCSVMGLRHEVLSADLRHLGTGLMAGLSGPDLSTADEWWPYRNQMLVTLAAMRFVGDGLREIMIGAVATDRYADGKAPFLTAIDRAVSVQEGGVRLTAPALGLTTNELLQVSGLPTDYLGLCFSCHAMHVPCGRCGGCTKQTETIRRSGWGGVVVSGLATDDLHGDP